jgi:hypothetical protein
LWMATTRIELTPEVPDAFSWPWLESGAYTSESTYRMLMEGGIRFPLAEAIWRSKTAPKIKIFKSQHRIWTSDRRLRHGLQTSMASCFKKKGGGYYGAHLVTVRTGEAGLVHLQSASPDRACAGLEVKRLVASCPSALLLPRPTSL